MLLSCVVFIYSSYYRAGHGEGACVVVCVSRCRLMVPPSSLRVPRVSWCVLDHEVVISIVPLFILSIPLFLVERGEGGFRNAQPGSTQHQLVWLRGRDLLRQFVS